MTGESLVLTADHVRRLRDHVIQDDGLERAAYIYCSEAGNDRMLAEELVLIDDADLAAQSRGGVRPSHDMEHRLVDDCLRRDMHPCIVHSHPFDKSLSPGFSSRDDSLMDGMHRFIAGHDDTAAAMFAVFGTAGVTAAVYPADTGERESLPVTVVGNRRLDRPLQNAASTVRHDTTGIDTVRFDRGIRALGEQGQQRLADTHVAVVGCGGLGDIMATELALYGVGELTLVDPDVVEASNLPRLPSAADHHVGRPKVAVTEQAVWQANPEITVNTVEKAVEDAADALHAADIIVAGVDQVRTREWLNRYAVRHMKPYVDAGVIITTGDDNTDVAEINGPPVESMDGYIQTVLPGATGCWDCLNRGDPEQARIERLSDEELEEEVEKGYVDESQLSPAAAVVPLNGVVASKTVQMVAKLVTGYSQPADYLHVETVDNELSTVMTTPRDACPTCGENGVLGRGTREPSFAEAGELADDLDLDTGAGTVELAPGTVDSMAISDAFQLIFDTW